MFSKLFKSFVVVGMVFSASAYSAFLPQGHGLTIAGRYFPNTSNLIILNAFSTSSSSPNATARIQKGTSGYQVTSGRTLKIFAVRMSVNAATAGIMQIKQTDNDVGYNTNTPLSGSLQAWPSNTSATTANGISVPATIGAYVEVPVYFEIASGKYLTVVQTTNSSAEMYLYGYEE